MFLNDYSETMILVYNSENRNSVVWLQEEDRQTEA